ncbi:MAG: CsbD family protein [Sphingobium sp.]|nr:CsbD family protein [Sphingobium sp.]
MGEMIDKIKGAGNQAAGRAKQAYGDAVGDSAVKAEGVGQELKGAAQKLKGAVKGAIDKL